MTLISRFLGIDDIVVGLDVPDKGRALEAAASTLERNHGISRSSVLPALWRREGVGSTGLGHGMAVPHARIGKIAEPILLVLRLKAPIEFAAPDGQPVSVLFVILVPEGATEEHLQILAGVAEKFSSKAFRDRLQAAPDARSILGLFSEGPAATK